MKVLHLNSYYLTNPLHSQFVLYIAKKGGVDQIVYVPIWNRAELSDASHGFNAEMLVQVIIDPIFSKVDRIFWPLKQLKIYRAVVKKVKIESVQIIHAHTLVVNGIIAYFLNRIYGIPYVVTVRNTDVNTFLSSIPFFKYLIKPVLRDAHSIYFLSPTYWNIKFYNLFPSSFLKELEPKVRVVPNGINGKWLENLAVAKQAPSNEVHVLFVGALVPNKNIMGVMETCRLSVSKGLKVTLSIVGKGPDKHLIDVFKGVEISYYGYVDSIEDLIPIYRKNHIMLIPSFTESFGLVYAEALSQGLPVLYSKGEGFDGQFEEGEVGFAVDPYDVNDISLKIDRVLQDYHELSKRCILGATKFDWKVISQSLIEDYQRIVEE